MRRCWHLLLTACLAAVPAPAWAQYKNTAFGLDLGGFWVSRVSIIDPATSNQYASNSALPIRLQDGVRGGGEIDFKLNHDHWWFSARVDMAGWFWPRVTVAQAITPDLAYDYVGAQNIGNAFSIQVILGPRYYFLTDRVRPYLQVGVSYEHLFAVSGNAGSVCADPTSSNLCAQGGSNYDVFLAHTNLLGVHGTFGTEFVVVRDFALTLRLDYEYSITFGGPGNSVLTGAFGIMFYG